MGTIVEKANHTLDVKNDMKAAFMERGMNPTDTLATYPDLIRNLDSIKFLDDSYGTFYQIADKENPLAVIELDMVPITGIPGTPEQLPSFSYPDNKIFSTNGTTVIFDNNENILMVNLSTGSDYSEKKIARISRDGNLLWSYYLPDGAFIGKGLAVDSSNNIYTGWREQAPTSGTDTSGYYNYLKKITQTGSVIWEVQLSHDVEYQIRGWDAEDIQVGTSYIFFKRGKAVYRSDASGSNNIIYTADSVIRRLIVDSSENIYIACSSGENLLKLSPSGDVIWSVTFGNLGSSTQLKIGKDGYLYMTDSGSDLYQINMSDGNYTLLPNAIGTTSTNDFLLDDECQYIYLFEKGTIEKKQIIDGAIIWSFESSNASTNNGTHILKDSNGDIYGFFNTTQEVVVVREKELSGYAITATCIPFE